MDPNDDFAEFMGDRAAVSDTDFRIGLALLIERVSRRAIEKARPPFLPVAAAILAPEVLDVLCEYRARQKAAARKSDERECHLCGRRGTRQFIQVAEGWKCQSHFSCRARAEGQ